MVISTLCPPQIAIDSRPKNSQAECLGLFVEAVPRETSETLVSSVLQALAQLCKGSEGSGSTPPWQVRTVAGMEETWAEMVEFPASHVGVPEGVAN